MTVVDQSFSVKLFENPPDRLHKPRIKGLVVILEVDPPPYSVDSFLPIARIPHHDRSAQLVIFGNAHFRYIIRSLKIRKSSIDTKILHAEHFHRSAEITLLIAELYLNSVNFVYFMLDGKTVCVPSEPPLDVISILMPIPSYCVLNDELISDNF